MKLHFTDHNESVVQAIKDAFGDEVEAHVGDIFDRPADCVVSPANSFGFMDGGVDYAYSQRWPRIQFDVQAKILIEHAGELPVGGAMSVATGDDDFLFLIVAPTMRVPADIRLTANVYLATRAALYLAKALGCDSILFPGMGTGCGKMPPAIAAKQMKVAWDAVGGRLEPPSSWLDATRDDAKLRGVLPDTLYR